MLLLSRKGYSDFKRWLYRGPRPHWMARILNRAWAAVASWGVAPNYLVTLEVTGRKSGRIVSLPLVMAVIDGQRYLVSMLGDNGQWVQNVRAAGGRAVLRSGGREEVQLEEVPTDQRAQSIIPAKRGKKTWRIHGVRAEMRRAFPRRQYARRALVETVFSTIKRKLSSRAPGRSLPLQRRQALLLGLTYNLYRL